MEKVDRLGQLMGALRGRMVKAAQRERAPSAAGEASPRRPAKNIEALRERLSQRFRALPRDAEEREARATRVFVESVLAWEFGDEMLSDPEFVRVVEEVGARISENRGLRLQLRGVLDELSEPA